MINTSQIARIALIALLIAGCFYVLRPFLAATLFAAIVCVSTWPFYEQIRIRLGNRDTLAAMIMTLLMLIALIGPMAYLAENLADGATMLLEQIKLALENPKPHAPSWLANLPLMGGQIDDFWQRRVASHEDLMKLLSQYYEPMRKFSLQAVQLVGGGLLQLLVAVFVAFFFYRDGTSLGKTLVTIARRLGGALGQQMLELSSSTVKAVMIGIVGTAAVQAAVALVGFLIAGAPAPVLLAAATFFLSMIPVGPPLVWGSAALWLLGHGETGWAIFLGLYGFFGISSVDNIVKPMLISQTARLPLLLIVLGVFGGAVAFGFIGIFLGPALLAVGLALTRHWIELHSEEAGAVP